MWAAPAVMMPSISSVSPAVRSTRRIRRSRSSPRLVTALLAQTDGIETYQVTLGSGGGLCIGGGGTNIATFSATVADDAPVFEVSDRLREAFGDLTGAGEIKVEAGGGGGFSATAVQVIVQADDPLTLRTAAEQGRGAVARTPDVVDVTSVLASSAPRIDVKVDRLAATRAGLTEAATGRAVAAAMRGTPLGQLTVDGATRCVVSRFPAAPDNLEQLRALPLPTAGGVVPSGRSPPCPKWRVRSRVSRIGGSHQLDRDHSVLVPTLYSVVERAKERLQARRAGAPATTAEARDGEPVTVS